MLTCKKTYNIFAIKKDWIALQEKGGLHTPFQEYDYMQRTWKLFYPYYLKKKFVGRFYSFYDEGECVMIVPVAHYLKGRDAELLANVNGLNYCDVLVADEKYVKPALAMMAKDYDTLSCSKVLERSLLYSAMKDSVDADRTMNNVCINFEDDYEAYNKSLSKSTRQNLRTAYNRLNSDGKELSFKVMFGGGNSFDYKPFIELYCERHAARYGVQTSGIKKWFLLHQSFATLNYTKNPRGLTMALCIDGQLAAFMSGMLGLKHEYVVPRLSINDEFGFYSPGMLLLNEAVKYFMKETEVRHLDLSQGEEPYKYKMGGDAHLSHSFKLDLKKILKRSKY